MLKQLISGYLSKKFVLGNVNRNDSVGAIHKAWGYVFTNFIQGDYIEFGVYNGNSLINSYLNYLEFKHWIANEMKSSEAWRRESAKQFINFSARFHGLDTFEGMPDNEEGHVTFAPGNFLADVGNVKRKCEKAGLREPQLQLYKGLFAKSKEDLIESVGDRKAAIINIDCDLYFSAKEALEMCEPFIQVGTVLIFDDYNTFRADTFKGERKAFREFCEKSNHKFEPWYSYNYVGQSFLCVS